MIYDGIEYTVDTATDNALNLLTYINQYLVTNNIKDSDGNQLQFVVNITSPIWLIILGLGYMFSIFQKLLYSCGLHFNISSCSETQLLNLAEIAGTEYLSGKGTIVTCNVIATSGGSCVITKDMTLTYDYEGVAVTFKPIYDVTITASNSGKVTMQTETIGPMYIPANAFTAFDTPPANFASMTSLNSIPGTNEEISSELRVRLQKGIMTISGIDACLVALRALSGVQTANLFFNTSLTESLVIASMTIPPRCCGMIVQGYSEELSNTYYDYLDVPCLGGANTQNYTTLAGQTLSITYDLPVQVNLYVKVKVRIPDTLLVPEEYKQAIINLLLPASSSLLIGQDYTQKYLLSYLNDFNIEGMEIIGLEVSTNGTDFSDTTDLVLNQICVIINTNISFVEVV